MAGMSYEDRLIIPAYTSVISQTRTTWKYREALPSAFQKRLDSRRYVGVDGVYHIGLGYDGRDYPMTCVFDGIDHDTDAQAFIRTLLETEGDKPGTLEHPVEGVKPVLVDSGSVVYDPVNDAAETVVSVLFQLQTPPPEISLDSPTVSTQSQFSALSASASADYEGTSFTATPKGKTSALQAMKAGLATAASTMGAIARGSALVTAKIDTIQDDILRDIDTIVKSPLTYASQMQILVNSIASIPGDIADKVRAWGALYAASRAEDGDTLTPTDANRNIVAGRELNCTAAVSNMFLAITNDATSFTSALDALNTLADVQAYRTDLEKNLAEQQAAYGGNVFQDQYVGQSETLDQMATMAQLAGDAIRAAVPLLGAQVSVVLSRDWDMLNFVYTHTGDTSDDTLNRIIDTNLLTLDEIILLPEGKEIFI